MAMEVLAVGDESMLIRPCVDCGLKTGRFCDYCLAETRLPNEKWCDGQMTPLCSRCDNKYDKCHFCRGGSVEPPATDITGAERPPPARRRERVPDRSGILLLTCSGCFTVHEKHARLLPLGV